MSVTMNVSASVRAISCFFIYLGSSQVNECVIDIKQRPYYCLDKERRKLDEMIAQINSLVTTLLFAIRAGGGAPGASRPTTGEGGWLITNRLRAAPSFSKEGGVRNSPFTQWLDAC